MHDPPFYALLDTKVSAGGWVGDGSHGCVSASRSSARASSTGVLLPPRSAPCAPSERCLEHQVTPIDVGPQGIHLFVGIGRHGGRSAGMFRTQSKFTNRRPGRSFHRPFVAMPFSSLVTRCKSWLPTGLDSDLVELPATRCDLALAPCIAAVPWLKQKAKWAICPHHNADDFCR